MGRPPHVPPIETGGPDVLGQTPGSVLIVDDEPLLLRSLRRILERDGHTVWLAESEEAAAPAIASANLDVVVVDVGLGSSNGLDLLDRLKRSRSEVEVIVMTGQASIESAVGCIRRGAFDYLAKPFDDVHRVRAIVRRAVERRCLVRRNHELEDAVRERVAGPGLAELVGNSSRLRALIRTIQSLRHNESHVLVEGESGTGKELVARAIHRNSPRARGPFVPVDCGALPETIIESELFGHVKGAFTGATGSPGLFRMAEGGTLFLDEIGEVPLAVQAKLLRALQEKEIRPVGSTVTVPVDIRVISATHRDLAAMVAEGRFRTDLYYRLDVVRIGMPALRERRDDIPLLVQHFLAKHQRPNSPIEGIEDDVLDRLTAADWPGNVRELENVVESALALADGPKLRLADLPLGRHAACFVPESSFADVPLSLAAYEHFAMERALRESAGDVARAAKCLGIGRSTFYRKLTHHRGES